MKTSLLKIESNFSSNSMAGGSKEIELNLGEEYFDIDQFSGMYRSFINHGFSGWLSKFKIKLLRIEFICSKPANLDQYLELYKCPLYFNQKKTALAFSLSTSDPPDYETNMESKIRGFLLDQCGNFLEFPRYDELAKAFHMSEKTLQRRLRRESVSYQEIKDSIRYEFVANLLKNTNLSLTEITYRAGFLEPGSLVRMFTKRAGVSPARYRKGIFTSDSDQSSTTDVLAVF